MQAHKVWVRIGPNIALPLEDGAVTTCVIAGPPPGRPSLRTVKIQKRKNHAPGWLRKPPPIDETNPLWRELDTQMRARDRE